MSSGAYFYYVYRRYCNLTDVFKMTYGIDILDNKRENAHLSI